MGIFVLNMCLGSEESNLESGQSALLVLIMQNVCICIISIHINRSISAILSQHELVNN